MKAISFEGTMIPLPTNSYCFAPKLIMLASQSVYQQKSTSTAVAILAENGLSLSSTLKDLIDWNDSLEGYEYKLLEALQQVSNPQKLIHSVLEDFEYPIHPPLELAGSKRTAELQYQPFTSLDPEIIAFHCVEEGYNAPIRDFIHWLCDEEIDPNLYINNCEDRTRWTLDKIVYGTLQACRKAIVLKAQKKSKSANTDIETKTNTNEIYEITNDHLCHFAGNDFDGNRIMSDEDYQRMIGYTVQLIENRTVPLNILPIHIPKRAGLKSDFIINSFHRLLSHFYPGERPDSWCEFIRLLFTKLKNNEASTIKAKLTNYKPICHNSKSFEDDLAVLKSLNASGSK